MHDRSISTSTLITASLWALSVVLMVGSWWVYVTISHEAAIMLATTAVVPLAGAVVSQVRCYSLRLCALLRATRPDHAGDVRALR